MEGDSKTIEPKKDCFAYRENQFDRSRRECACLTELICANKKKCSFYKPKGEQV